MTTPVSAPAAATAPSPTPLSAAEHNKLSQKKLKKKRQNNSLFCKTKWLPLGFVVV